MIRPYAPGDDVRRIDWNVTARTNEPHVRVDLAERVLVTWLVLDTSPSMQFGTADRRKADVAEGVAIAIGHLATRRGNRLGIATFGAPSRSRTRRGRAAAASSGSSRALHEGGGGHRRRGPPSLGEAIARTGALARQRALDRARLRLPRPARLAAPAARARGTPRRDRDRDPRPARAGALERRPALARRSRDGPPAPRRHAQPPAARAFRRRRRRGARARCGRSSPRSAPATSSSRPRATGCGTSSSSCAGAAERCARELHLADRAARPGAASRARRALRVRRDPPAEVAGQRSATRRCSRT